MVGAHRKKGHSTKFCCPITKLEQHLLAIIYVDNTDILHMDLTKDKSVEEVLQAIQSSINSWGNLIIVTCGVLQPSKCYYLIISYEWEDGQWRNVNNGLSTICKSYTPHKKTHHTKKTTSFSPPWHFIIRHPHCHPHPPRPPIRQAPHRSWR